MENKNKNSSSSSENNSSPFPKLKPKGPIYLNEVNNNKDNKSSQKNTNKSKENEEESDFLSKLRKFDPNANININKASKPPKPLLLENSKKNNNNNEKDIEENLNINKEKGKISRKKLSYEIGNNNDDDKKDITNTKRLSAKNTLDSAKKIFNSISGYLNENIINKININFNFNNTEEKGKSFADSINLDENFEKPKNFSEIEKIWNYKKLLLEYNILDLTSKYI